MLNNINDDVDEEWKKFMSTSYYDDVSSDEEEDGNSIIKNDIITNVSFDYNSNTPISSNIYISTKTKIAYLNNMIDLKNVFWQIPIIPYAQPSNGVIKKQIKFNSVCIEELNDIQEKLSGENYFEEHVITNINNPNGRIKFKDIRKVTIGISKKDIMSYRCKKKSAFYNCFVLILRIKIENIFKEFHVKIFNTGKLEIPGIQSEKIFIQILNQIIGILQPYVSLNLNYKENSAETVLINSNFNCGFYINREILYDILKFRYNIQCIYDPCSYPGIQCKFYYNPEVEIQTGSQISEENKALYTCIQEVSFMIFRTGSVLIVGKCDENVLLIIYEFLKIILNNEYKEICQKNLKTNEISDVLKNKKKKIRKKTILINTTPNSQVLIS